MKTENKKQGGFTLIELMIVITIIGILASIAVPAYREYTIRARVAECASLYSPIKTDTSLVYSETGNLPGGLEDLPRTSNTTTDFDGDYVESIDVAGDVGLGLANTVSTVSCQLQTSTDLGLATGTILTFVGTATSQRVNWRISAPAVNGTPSQYWPNDE